MNQLKTAMAGAQTLFVIFGAMVPVPFPTGLDPTLALLGAGLGTLLFQLVIKRKVLIFLGSSFALIALITYSVEEWDLPSTMLDLFAASFIYSVFVALIRRRGLDVIHKLLLPVVIDPVIMVIDLSVAATASNMTMGQSGGEQVISYIGSLTLSGSTFAVAVIVSAFGNKMVKPIPTLIGVASGYVPALIMGLVSTGTITDTPWFTIPHFETPQVNWQAALFMLSVAIASVIGHIGGIMVIDSIAGKNYTKDPGLDKALVDDSLGVRVAGLIGGPSIIAYGEITGTVMVTKNSNPVIMTWMAIFMTCMAFFGKFNMLSAPIPMSVMGGIMLLLFGTTASLGIKTLIDARVDLMQPRDLVIASSILTTGIGGTIIRVGTLSFAGVGLCVALTIILNCVPPSAKSEEV